MNTSQFCLSLVLVTLGCGSPDPGARDGSLGDGATPRADGGPEAPLRLEVLDPVRGQALSCVIEADAPMICAANYLVRARVTGTGAADVHTLEFGSTATLGYYPAPVVDGPDGRVAEATVLVGRNILGSGTMSETVGVRVGEGPAAPEAGVTITVDFR